MLWYHHVLNYNRRVPRSVELEKVLTAWYGTVMSRFTSSLPISKVLKIRDRAVWLQVGARTITIGTGGVTSLLDTRGLRVFG